MHNFKKKFGQNFLKDKNLLKAIVSDAEISSQEDVLEIGAGAGALTEELSKKAKKVVSYEIDKELEETLLELKLKNVRFVFANALKVPIEEIEKDFVNHYKLVANLPYYITTPLIFKFLELSNRIQSLTIMVQKEVAERMTANVGDEGYGILSVMMKFYGNAKIMRIVKRNMFFPMPEVDSALVRVDIENKYDLDKFKFSAFVRNSFAMKRKTLINNLEAKYNYKKSELEKIFLECDLSFKIRAEDLDIEEFITLYKKLQAD